jgi:hypothetical protein
MLGSRLKLGFDIPLEAAHPRKCVPIAENSGFGADAFAPKVID